jgi:signal transduction histidine kinase/CheY-like chemotaxis protein
MLAEPALRDTSRGRVRPADAPPLAGSATFVAASGPTGASSAAVQRAELPDTDGRLSDEALRAATAAAPAMFVAFAIALAADVVVLAPSPWRSVWLGCVVAVTSAWAITIAAGRRRSRPLRGAWRWQRSFTGLAVVSMLLLALPPWIPGPAPPAVERIVAMLALAGIAMAGATVFASVPVPLAVAVALPLSPALAEWMREGGTSGAAIAGVLLAMAAALVAAMHRRIWQCAAHASLQREDRMRELEDARDAAVRADQEKSRFLAIASHDLRQPMHALGLFAATLEKRLRGSGEEPLVHNLARSIDALDGSFSVMLDISRLDAGTIEPNFQLFPLRDLFRRLHMHFAGQAEQAGLGLRFSPGGKLVTSDPQLLERILGNLIQNALRYTENGGIVVVARTTRAFVNVEVWDTGVGIQRTELPRIFNEFYQVGRGERARERGLGMGLAIVKRLALLLGHRLVVSSRPGRGTMFRVGIPVGGLPEIQDVTAAADTLPMPLPVPQPRTVLIVDDEESIRQGLTLLLEEWGYQALAAGTVEQAGRVVGRLDAPPDLILSDLHLGDGPDGIAAIDAVRRQCGFDVPAILITGDTSHDELRRATDSGHPVLFKPVQPRKLLNALRGHIP